MSCGQVLPASIGVSKATVFSSCAFIHVVGVVALSVPDTPRAQRQILEKSKCSTLSRMLQQTPVASRAQFFGFVLNTMVLSSWGPVHSGCGPPARGPVGSYWSNRALWTPRHQPKLTTLKQTISVCTTISVCVFFRDCVLRTRGCP